MKLSRTSLAAAVLAFIFSTSAGACTVSTTGLSFGTIGLLTDPEDSTATITINCPANTPYEIGLSGSYGSGAASRLTSGTDQIDYGTFEDPGRNDPWGEIGGADGSQTGTGTGSDQQYTVYGRIYRQASPAAGSYTDTVTITVSY